MTNGINMLTEPSKLEWFFEIVGPIVCLGIAMYLVYQCLQQRQLTRSALIFVAGLSASWQEYFGDWGTYMLFNPHFGLIPWESTTWTTPFKPWCVLPGYGWFYLLSFLGFFWVLDRVRVRRPDLNRWVVGFAIGIPMFYLTTLMVDTIAVVSGMWSYTRPIGPTLRMGNDNYPLLYPLLLVAVWMSVMGTLLYWRDTDGYTMFDNLVGTRRWAGLVGSREATPGQDFMGGGHTATLEVVEEQRLSVAAQVARLISWIVGFNLSYWFLAIFPTILIRIFVIAEPSALVP